MPFFAKNRHITDAFDECKHRFFFTERGIFPDFHSPSWNIYRIKSPFGERAGWKCLTLELCLRRVDFLLEFEDGRLGKPCVAGHHFDGKSVQKEVLCYFLRLFPGRTVFPVRLVDVFHDVTEHISGTKITQFHFILQYPEH